MSDLSRSHFRRVIEEAEGYLELAVMFDDRDFLEPELKVQLGDRALEVLSQFDDEEVAQVLYLRGQALRTCRRYDEAIELLDRAWQQDDTNIHTCLALGWCYKRTGQVGLAIEALQKGLTIDRDSAILHYNMACYLALLNQTKMAVIHLSTALDINGQLRSLVKKEPDFDTIREDPEFQAIATVNV